MHNLQVVQGSARVWFALVNDCDDGGRRDKQEDYLYEPILLECHHTESKDKLSRQEQCGVLKDQLSLVLLVFVDKSEVEGAPFGPEDLIRHQVIVIPIVKENDGQGQCEK